VLIGFEKKYLISQSSWMNVWRCARRINREFRCWPSGCISLGGVLGSPSVWKSSFQTCLTQQQSKIGAKASSRSQVWLRTGLLLHACADPNPGVTEGGFVSVFSLQISEVCPSALWGELQLLHSLSEMSPPFLWHLNCPFSSDVKNTLTVMQSAWFLRELLHQLGATVNSSMLLLGRHLEFGL